MKNKKIKKAKADSMPAPEFRAKVSGKRQLIFVLIMVIIPIAFIAVLEVSLRVLGYGININLFVPAHGHYSKYYKVNPLVTYRFFTEQENAPNPPNDLFLMKKPENGFRIFVLGGSTTAGYPYGNNIMFSRILHQRLSDAFPEKYTEVVNIATVAINSYALLDFMDEILEKEPDAILIYAGHNEFYGALGVASTEALGKFRPLIKIYLKLKQFKAFQLLRSAVWQIKKGISSLSKRENIADPSATLMERLVREQNIPYRSSIYEAGKKQFQNNLRDILKKAKQAKVPVLISELVSNIRDQAPFVSVLTKNFPTADHAFQTAKILEGQGRFDEAKLKYYLAKDLDALRFRAPEEFNEIIHQVAKVFDAIVVPMKPFFEAASPQGIPGKGLFLEHLHPNIDGYFKMADAFFETMRKNSIISPHWPEHRIAPASYYRDVWGFTALDSLYGDLRIKILKGGWPFQPKTAPNRAILDYLPATRAESLAVKVWSEYNYSLERGHVDMATSFESAGRYREAYEEYKALICLTPLNVSPYLKAADMSIKGGNYTAALSLLRKSLTLEESAYANKWIGQILLNNNDPKSAIPYLEKAIGREPRDFQLLYNLGGAYALNAEYSKAKEKLDELYRMAPGFPDPFNLRGQVEGALSQEKRR